MLAFDFSKGGIPTLKEDWRWEDRGEAVLSACSHLVSVINNNGTRVVQFSHSSVIDFLMSDRLANSMDDISRFHILIEPAHATLAQACLGALLRLDEHTDEKSVKQIPLAQYAGQHWVRHARFGDVESHIIDAMDYFLDVEKSHFTAWVRIQYLEDLLQNYPAEDLDERMTAIPQPAAPLYFAVERGFRGLVERLLVKYPQQVNVWGGKCGTPLHGSALRGRVEVAQLLVAHGADVNSRSSFEGTPLHAELTKGKHREPLPDSDSNVNIDSGSSSEESSLHPALEGEPVERWDWRLKSHFLYDRTPLHTASEEGHLIFAEWLLDSGAEVNVQDMTQNTPLHLATTRGRLDLVKMLLQRGADPQTRGQDGRTPLFSAVEGGNPDIVSLLLDHGADAHIRDKDENNALHIAAAHGHLEVARLLLALNLEVNARNSSRMTPLYNALNINGKPDVVRLLLDHGAAVRKPVHGKRCRSALHLAAESGNSELVQMILELNPDIEARNAQGETPLLTASSEGNPAVIQLLLDHGADPYVHDKDGKTALDKADTLGVSRMLIKLNVSQTCAFLAAADRGDPEQMRLLLDYGASPNVRGDWGTTPLHLAAARGRLGAVRFLVLEANVDIDAKDSDGSTPLHDATWGPYVSPEVVQFLLEHGADALAPVDSEWGEKIIYDFVCGEKKEEIQALLSKYGAAAA